MTLVQAINQLDAYLPKDEYFSVQYEYDRHGQSSTDAAWSVYTQKSGHVKAVTLDAAVAGMLEKYYDQANPSLVAAASAILPA